MERLQVSQPFGCTLFYWYYRTKTTFKYSCTLDININVVCGKIAFTNLWVKLSRNSNEIKHNVYNMCRNNDNVKNWEYDENDGTIFSLFSGSSKLVHLILEDSNLTTLGNIKYINRCARRCPWRFKNIFCKFKLLKKNFKFLFF